MQWVCCGGCLVFKTPFICDAGADEGDDAADEDEDDAVYESIHE